ncbi:MAG: fibronectin type III domain-containing protein [Candidatus Zixiibacteriota bacterium]
MRKYDFICLFLILSLASVVQGTTRYVKPTGTGTRDGSTWANAGPPAGQTPVGWLNSVMVGGDTAFFAPGSYIGEMLIPPANANRNDRTCYAAGDGVTANTIYDPGINYYNSLVNPSRLQFEASVAMAKACTLSGATRVPAGTAWTSYDAGQSTYSTPVSLPQWNQYSNRTAHVAGQDTLKVKMDTSLAQFTSDATAGRAYYDKSAGVLYFRTTTGASPTNFNIYATRRPSVSLWNVNEADYVSIIGFDIRYSEFGGVDIGNSPYSPDSVWIEHCRITRIASGPASNECAVSTRSGGTMCQGNRIRACYVMYIDENNSVDRATIITTYSHDYTVVDSCLIDGVNGAEWKNQAAAARGYANVFKYNTVKNAPAFGYCMLGNQWGDSCYGNYFINNVSHNISYRADGLYGAPANYQHFVANNSIYTTYTSASAAMVFGQDGSRNAAVPSDNYFKYNLAQGTQYGSYIQWSGGSDTSWLCSNNLFWNSDNFFVGYTWTNWIARRSGNWTGPVLQDIGSIYATTPLSAAVGGYANPAAGDLSRPNSLPEIDVTYGGKRWTRIGAWQPGGSTPPIGLNSIVADSLRCDYSGENDSLRFRFQTSAQTWPDSVIVAISLTNALPSSAQGSDRWARPYLGALRLDTLRITKLINETDTVIVGGWVRDNDSGFSAGVYDTIILTQPVVAPTPLTSLFFDSLRCDFSGESDSMRIRFSTGTQTFPDSVIFAITTNGTLPTVTSTDRSAVAYAGSITDTIPLVRTITETDTLILGGWVKDGGTYSSARYDTLILAQPSLSPLVSVIIDSTRADYSGEADSLRIRYTTSAQTFPDSVVLALSTTATLPTPSSTDRWARAYVGARTDTSYAIRAIVESDTVIIGAWTKDGTTYSTARYDTVFLIQPPTNPVTSVFLDSVRCDYSGESDSLRVRYTTGTQTFPDSVIYAVSLTGALPTQSQSADRFARRYFASRTDSAIVVKAIAESDTVIVGTWVKDANTYSVGRYDTLFLIQPPTSPLVALAIDSVRNDFSGETDSIRIRYTTSSQVFPDSVILALTSDGTLPTTGSPDRFARSYAASRTDTARIIRAVAEPDTIIIGAWVKDAAGISTARFDTLIYAVPAATPPEPLVLIAIDSIRSDYAGENDSLRVRWQTGTQTTPDSVVFALSLSGTLPGINASDRFTSSFVSNITDTTVIARAITEADTVIIGGWVKEGAVWSSARYDTVVLFSASPEPLVALALDSLHNDYSVENDSIRIRFSTGAQTWPDSVVFALTTDGSQPTLSSSDRFSRVFSASATDTVIISRSIVESATLILAAWVREGGSWSPALYDTLTYALPAPQPLVFVVIDSVQYDYAGENDSLRIVYRTGQESWPDSVIIAISFTSALPTVNSPDRWARLYIAGNSQSFFFSRLINEPDTIIIGGWVKNGSQLSAPIYDTIPLMPVLVYSNVTVTDISSSSASLSWTTSLLATSQVEYGPTTQYGFATTRDANKVLNHTVVITGLSAATTYHFRLLCDPGNGVQQSSDSSFVTSLATGGEVAISGEEVWFVTDSSALVMWTTSVAATSQVQYGARGRYKKSTPEDKSYAVGHSVYLQRLSPKTTYTYRVVSAEPSGTRAYGEDQTFTTAPKNQPNLAAGKPVASRIDGSSTTPVVLTDDVIDTCGATTEVWVSDDNRNQPQWVEIDLGSDSLVSEVIIYWACDTLGETWLTSQQYSIQAWNGVGYFDAAVVISPEIDHASINGFPDTLRTTRLRIYQPPNLGSADHPARLALTEVQIYGTEQFTPPTDTTGLTTSSPSAFNVSQPILRIENLPDSLPAGSSTAAKTTADRFYYFAVAEDTNMISIVVSSPAVPEEEGTVTSWKIPFPLEPNRTYYWQASVDSLFFSKVYAFTVYPQTHAYPNPFKMDQGGTVVFTGIPSGSNLIMISISGEVVKRWTNNTGEDIVWDGMNESGHTVSSGVYLWYIENSDIKGQLIVLR